MNKIYFISDLHLSPNHPEIMQAFAAFCKKIQHRSKQLYILGDLFEYWVGPGTFPDLEMQLSDQLKALHRSGTEIFIMRGNRDFLIDETFAEHNHARWIPDPYQIIIDDQNIILSHGDGLLVQDKLYQWIRPILQNPFLGKCFLRLPLKWRQLIAKHCRKHSRGDKTRDWDLKSETIQNLLQAHQASLLIHGHTHQPTIHLVKAKQHFIQRIVLSDWYPKMQYLEVENGQYQLR